MIDDKNEFLSSGRRTFLKTALATGVASAVPVSAFGITAAEDAKSECAPKLPSWETPPAPIPESAIKETITTELLVVGAGTAGLCTAVSAAENGAKVIVIAKDPTVSGRGGSNFAYNSKLTRQFNIKQDAVDVYARVLPMHSHRVNEKQWWIFADQSGAAMDWLIDKMVAAGLKPVIQQGTDAEGWGTHMFLGGPHGSGTSADPQIDVCNALVEDGKKHGVQVFFRTRAEQLVREKNGRVTAVIAKKKDGTYVKYVATKAVVLATGDYAADKQMLAKFCPNAAGMQSFYAPPESNSGDGHKMAMWVGASLQKGVPHAPMLFPGPSNFDFSAFARLSKEESALLPSVDYMMAHIGVIWNLAMNKYGERYAPEDLTGGHYAAQIGLQPGEEVYSIWDSTVFSQFALSGYLGGPQPTEEEVRKVVDILAAHGIWYKKSDTIEGLATQLGLSPEKVRNTVDRYNGFCAAGVDEEFHKSKATLLSLKKPPYYGMAIGRLLLITVGGLLTDNQMHVLDADHNVIPGLYAVGTLSGDYFSNCYTTHMPGNNLGRCLTFGYLTGRQLAKETI